MARLAIIGTGYVGLTTGACFAHLGHEVVCADLEAEKVARLSVGDVPIFEDRLEFVVREGIEGGRLRQAVWKLTEKPKKTSRAKSQAEPKKRAK